MKLKYNDEMHAYWLDGKRCKGVSSVAKVPNDSYQLEQWRKRMVLVGVARQPSLVDGVDLDDRNELDQRAEQALQLAGTHDAAARGTAVHEIIERHILGEDVDDPFIVESFENVMQAAGLTPVREMVERVVVFPEERICGRFDHVAVRESDGKLVMVDLKTGASAVRYPHSVTVQLAMYANAPLWAVMDGDVTEEFEPAPAVDKEVAYVLSMTDRETAVYGVNIRLGWRCVEKVVFPTLRWRAIPNTKLIQKVS